MYSKIIFVLATVCVVNASVLTANVFDDDTETDIKVRPHRCYSKVCDWLCHKLIKTNGTCVNGRCKCEKFLIAEDANDMIDPAELLSPRDCNFRACEQQCRRLGFPGGACVNGRCKCDNFLKTNDAIDMIDPAEILSPRDCNFRACEQLCRRLGFPSGACVNGRCKCDNFLKTDDANAMIDPAEILSPRDCNFVACEQQCRRLGFPGGACVNGRCKCDNFLKTDVTEQNVRENSGCQPRACNNRRCHQICRKQKFRGGACVGPNCYCNKFLSLLDDTLTDSVEKISLHSCNSIACDDECRRTGWHSGVCINGQCKCDYFLNTEDSMSPKICTAEACNALCRKLQLGEGVCTNGRCRCNNYKPTLTDANAMTDPAEILSSGDCNFVACEQLCRRLGFPGGACVNGRCKCDNFLKTNVTEPKDEVSEESLTVSELSEDQTGRSCNPQACDQLCRRLKFPGGVCVNGRCKCDNFLGTGVEAVDEYSELATKSVCHVRKCNRTCNRRGYAGSRCVNGQCQCYDKIKREVDTSLLKDVTNDGNADKNEILRTNEDVNDVTDPAGLLSPGDCNFVACEQQCRRLGFPGGACVNGRCKCDNFLKTDVTEPKDEVSEESLTVSELSEDQTGRSCNPQACDQLCRRLKFPGGVCVNGRCKCDNFLGTGVDAVDEYSELATKRDCHVRKCSRTCTRRGYAGSRCVNGQCECYDKIERKVDTSLLNDVTNDENADSNEILRTNEEDPIETAPRNCNTVSCNQWCHRLNYAGGWCRFGQCQCY